VGHAKRKSDIGARSHLSAALAHSRERVFLARSTLHTVSCFSFDPSSCSAHLPLPRDPRPRRSAREVPASAPRDELAFHLKALRSPAQAWLVTMAELIAAPAAPLSDAAARSAAPPAPPHAVTAPPAVGAPALLPPRAVSAAPILVGGSLTPLLTPAPASAPPATHASAAPRRRYLTQSGADAELDGSSRWHRIVKA
jgi:Tfp pilus assembly protein FimV